MHNRPKMLTSLHIFTMHVKLCKLLCDTYAFLESRNLSFCAARKLQTCVTFERQSFAFNQLLARTACTCVCYRGVCMYVCMYEDAASYICIFSYTASYVLCTSSTYLQAVDFS